MAASTGTPHNRRERPAKPALTRSGIIATAVELMRAEGLERVTMRRLAQQLDTGPASLYVYVRNTAELHAAVLEELLGVVDLAPVRTEGDWTDRLVAVLLSYTAVLFEHPGLAQSAMVSRPVGPNYLRLLDGLLALLAEGGVPGDRASWAVDLLLQFGTATAAEQVTRHRAVDAEEEHHTLTAAVRDISATRYPHIAARGLDLLSGPGEARTEWGFRVLIAGAQDTPRPPHDHQHH
ncbi:MAG TPA: TetR/AcrR family transcriptional regulator [Pseudonocardiaceae bacterium]|jgi:AcrR family transcriptional regulator|nr:TetR/AcrR family transcriptional regulator [Pseudonocardiaceae bacterium]